MGILSRLAIIGLAPALAACSIHPLPEDVTRKATYDIVEQIRCEARRAVAEYARSYTTASIAYEFEFDITEDNNASADVTALIPFSRGGSFSLTANAGSNRIRSANRNFKIIDTFDQLLQNKCYPDDPAKNWIYPIAGDIGIEEVVDTFIKLQKVENPRSGEVFTFSDTLTFTTTFSGGVQPKLVLAPVTDRFRVVEANADFNAKRVDVHKVTLSLAGSPPKASRVLIGSSLRAVPGGVAMNNNSLVNTTIIQSAANPKDRALIELDRQRTIALQRRSQNLLVGP